MKWHKKPQQWLCTGKGDYVSVGRKMHYIPHKNDQKGYSVTNNKLNLKEGTIMKSVSFRDTLRKIFKA